MELLYLPKTPLSDIRQTSSWQYFDAPLDNLATDFEAYSQGEETLDGD